MPGIYSKANRPKLAGAYFNFVNKSIQNLPVGEGGIVAIPFTHDWGPSEEVVRVGSVGEFQSIFGNSDDTDGYRAVSMAFRGEDVDGRGGANQVLCFRQVGAAGVKATLDLSNGTDTDAVTVTARYDGSRGNDLRITIQEHVADTDYDELIVLDGATVLETYVYIDDDLADLTDQINGEGAYTDASDWITAVMDTDGTALVEIDGEALATGADGEVLLAADWTAFQSAIEIEPFDVLAAYKLTDAGIQADLLEWAVGTPEAPGLNLKGKRFFVVVGGLAGESLATAVTRSEALADPNVLNVGRGTVTDDSLGAGGTAIDLSTSELTARVAGIKAARAEYQSLTHARLRGVTIKVGATVAEQNSAFDEGVIVFASDSHSTAPVHLKTGLSTWTAAEAAQDTSKPYLIYRQPKYVQTMHGIEGELTQYAEEEIVGLRPINDQTREALLGRVKGILTTREKLGVIQPGWTAGIDQDPPPTDEDEFIAVAISLKFGRALEQVYFTVSVA